MEASQQTQQQQPQSTATGNTNQPPTFAGGSSSIDSWQTTAQQILALLQQQQQQLQQQQIQLQSLLQQQSLASSAPAASSSSSAASGVGGSASSMLQMVTPSGSTSAAQPRPNPLGFNADPYSALQLQQEQLQVQILDPSVNVDTLQQELNDLTACFALVERTSELRIPDQDSQTSSDDSPAVPQLRRHILSVSEMAATLSTSMVLPWSFRRFKTILEVNRYLPDLWYLALVSQITDPDAFHWAKQTLASDMTWEDIRAEFLDHFTSLEYESKLQDEYHSFKAKPGETVRAIGDCLRSLCDQMVNKLSTPALLHKFRSALPKDI
ncbi:S-adenosylmethionine-dependent methyltransferase-like protein [Balamuthia mandrillaris]